MYIISQNLRNYKLVYPDDTIMRINLAWVQDLEELNKLLNEIKNDIF